MVDCSTAAMLYMDIRTDRCYYSVAKAAIWKHEFFGVQWTLFRHSGSLLAGIQPGAPLDSRLKTAGMTGRGIRENVKNTGEYLLTSALVF
jgi:hypothetical protein